MAQPHEPQHGSMVIYRRAEEDEQERYRMAVVVGPVLTEPVSGEVWVGVQLPGRDDPLDFIDVDSIIESRPPSAGEPRNAA